MPSALSIDSVSSKLATKWLGHTLYFEAEVDSTNTRASQLAKQGESHGTVFISDAQTKGRGRLERRWHSPAGANLYFSVLLRPNWKPGPTPPLSLAAGVAIAEAAKTFLPHAPDLKWPNDVLYKGQKLAGILVETGVDPEGLRYAVVGIGLNVNQKEFPPEITEIASSLSLASGKTLDRADVLTCVLGRLESWFDLLDQEGAEPIVAGWQQHSSWIGQRVNVQNGDRVRTGTALGLDPNGALRLQDDEGAEHLVVVGDAMRL